jgi:hypothetical protein
MKMSTLSKAQANKIINTLFSAIPDIYQGFYLMRDNMERLEKEAEKQHRRNRPAVNGFSVGQAAKYFTIQHLYQGKSSNYTVEDMIDIRHEALMGQAYATRYRKELAQWFELVEQSQFKEVDYSDLMK